MCETKANGGKRCAAHARVRFASATLGTPQWDAAASEYARTSEGRKCLTQGMGTAVSDQDWSVAAAYQSALAAAERAEAVQADYNNRIKRAVLAASATGDAEELRKWSTSDNDRVVEAVAANRRTPDDVLRDLAVRGSVRVRCAIARREHAPVDVLERLARDLNDDVRFSGSLTLDRPHSVVSLWAGTDTGSRSDFAQRTRAVEAADRAGYGDVLERLADDPDYRVRAAVAGKGHTPTEALSRLLDDSYPSVAGKAARCLAKRQGATREGR